LEDSCPSPLFLIHERRGNHERQQGSSAKLCSRRGARPSHQAPGNAGGSRPDRTLHDGDGHGRVRRSGFVQTRGTRRSAEHGLDRGMHNEGIISSVSPGGTIRVPLEDYEAPEFAIYLTGIVSSGTKIAFVFAYTDGQRRSTTLSRRTAVASSILIRRRTSCMPSTPAQHRCTRPTRTGKLARWYGGSSSGPSSRDRSR
jgi:hypothetical protein